MRRRRIGTFDELLALDPKDYKFHSVLSSEESKKVIEQSKRPMTSKEAYDYAEQDFRDMKAYRKDKKDLQ